MPNKLVRLTVASSWKTLYEAAKIRQFEPILKLACDHMTELSDILYHSSCTSDFTHKKALAKLGTYSDKNEQMGQELRQPKCQRISDTSSRVYEKICILCEKKSKYRKGSKSREKLTQAVDLRADVRIRDVANLKSDGRILSLTSRDIVAAEAHYHASCYKAYVKEQPAIDKSNEQTENPYKSEVDVALVDLYKYIRSDLFSKPRIIPLTDLTSKLESILSEKGVEVSDSTKNHLSRNLKTEFG